MILNGFRYTFLKKTNIIQLCYRDLNELEEFAHYESDSLIAQVLGDAFQVLSTHEL